MFPIKLISDTSRLHNFLYSVALQKNWSETGLILIEATDKRTKGAVPLTICKKSKFVLLFYIFWSTSWLIVFVFASNFSLACVNVCTILSYLLWGPFHTTTHQDISNENL